MTLYEYDQSFGIDTLCGVDEAGRGPLAGDVYAAAVILKQGVQLEGLNDSKKLTAKKRDALFDRIIDSCESYCIATASVEEIERENILQATFLAMRRAVAGLQRKPNLVLIDGNQDPGLGVATQCVIKGDATSASIAAASILAKVARDRYMETVAQTYPQYQFEKHKGYGTKLHYQMLDEYGPSRVHRMSFLKKYYEQKQKTQAQEIGQTGEQLALAFLQHSGYIPVCMNYHSRYGEIDLIVKDAHYLVFAEVKSRKATSMVTAAEAVTYPKQQRIIKTAIQYLNENQTDLQPRFDVLEVCKETGRVNQIENAFGVDEDTYF